MRLHLRGGGALAGLALLTAVPVAAQTLTGAGATFPNPIYTKWFDAYAKQTGVRINYQSIGSGGGIRQFTEGTVDFGATDGPMNDEQIKAVNGNVLHVPIHSRMLHEHLELRAEQKLSVRKARVEQRLYTEPVPREKESFRACVPDCERKHAIKPI